MSKLHWTVTLLGFVLAGATLAAEPPAGPPSTPEAIPEGQALSTYLLVMSHSGPEVVADTTGISLRSAADLLERYKREEEAYQYDLPRLDQEHRDRLCSGSGTREAVLAEFQAHRDAVGQRAMEAYTKALSVLTPAEREKVYKEAMELRSSSAPAGADHLEETMGGTSNYRAVVCGGAP